MIKRMSLPTVLLLLLAVLNATVLAKSASVLLREGLYAEEVEGDLNAAIKVYQQVIEDESAQDNLVAQALYRQGMCYMKLKKESEAKAAFGKLVAEHADQPQLIEKVRPLLDELSNADPASLMPPETIMYVEIGSPGKQIETILNMLKDTPFENPLAMMGDQNQWSGGDMGPGNMISALLNPSMMAEFKKIRGMGIGVTGIRQNNPPAIAVLYPGQSDALRGLLLAGLGMVGRPADPIEGMNVLQFPPSGGAAYDDTVIILASPSPEAMDQLTWSIKQYKGLLKQPSLASSNRSFAKISKHARQNNALTLWVNVNEAYQGLMKVMPPDAIPQQIHMANGLVDFQNIDDIIASLSIEETGIAVEANVALKEGHNCVAYNMIRTPHLSKDAFRALPAETIALVSLALGEPDTAQANAVSEQILNVTSLDIGRELFSNIEQITLFAVPLEGSMEAQEGEIPPQLKAFGLAITSANPQQTRQILTSVLRSANAIQSETQPINGRYQITLMNDQNIFGYMDPANKTTLLSLNSDLITASVAALKRGPTAGKGVLKSAVNALPGTTSKVVMVNVAGAIQFGLQNMDLPDDKLGDQVREAMDRLAKASARTTIQLQTNEEANSLGVRLSINDLPPVADVVESIMQIQQAMAEIEGQAWRLSQEGPAAGIAPAKTAPIIDGQVDGCWAGASQYALKNSYYGAPSSAADLSASFKAVYDKDNLYVLIDVADDDLQNDSEEFWLDDAVEVFIDADNSKRNDYDDNDFQYHFGWDADSPVIGESQHNNMAGVKAAFARTDAGYRAEIKLPWSTLGTQPVPGTPIGLDVQVSDDDGGGDRDSKIAWRAPQDDAYLHPRVFGTAQPLGLVGWWKLDESGDCLAPDASGNGRTGKLIGGPTWRPTGGKIAGALEFDGQDDYVDTGYKADSPTWTVAAWVKSPSAPSGDKQTGPVHREKNYQINWDHMMDEFRGGAATCVDGAWYAASFGPLEANTWYHLAATYDGENLKAYKNGALMTNRDEPSGAPDAEVETLKFGRHATNEAFFRGTVDDVHLYNYALGSAEIAALAGK